MVKLGPKSSTVIEVELSLMGSVSVLESVNKEVSIRHMNETMSQGEM